MLSKSEEWGAEIPIVDGVRPVWLGDGDVMQWRLRHDKLWMGIGNRAEAYSMWDTFYSIRLPASHWAYLPLSRGFTPWAGGEDAPGDWDGGKVLFRNAGVWSGRGASWRHEVDNGDIIGYRRRGEVPCNSKGPASDIGMPISDPDTVTLKRMTEAEWLELKQSENGAHHDTRWLSLLKRMDLVKPIPTQAQRIASATGLPVNDVERVIELLKGEG